MRSLVADDDLIARLLLSEILADFGPSDTVVNGEEAVRAFRLALQRGRPYDLICLDIMMPGMDGQEALKKIRKIEEAQGITGDNRSVIIMITAVLDEINKTKAFTAECNLYMTKPIDNELLFENLRSYTLID